MKSRWIYASISIVALGIGFAFAMTAPVDRLQGEYTRIIHVHVPTAWLAFLAFGVTALGSIGYLIRRNPRWDRMAASSAEIGVLFTGLALITGMIWGNVVWGRPWDWGDARLTTTALMFFVYLGYLALRRAIDDPEARARRSAILGVIAVVQVPLVYFSVNLFRTLHQVQSISPGGADMPTGMLVAMLVNLAAFTVLYVSLLVWRMGIAQVETERELAVDETAGSSVTAPKLGELQGGSDV